MCALCVLGYPRASVWPRTELILQAVLLFSSFNTLSCELALVSSLSSVPFYLRTILTMFISLLSALDSSAGKAVGSQSRSFYMVPQGPNAFRCRFFSLHLAVTANRHKTP